MVVRDRVDDGGTAAIELRRFCIVFGFQRHHADSFVNETQFSTPLVTQPPFCKDAIRLECECTMTIWKLLLFYYVDLHHRVDRASFEKLGFIEDGLTQLKTTKLKPG